LAFATFVIRRANAAFTTFPTVFSSEIGRQAPGVAFWGYSFIWLWQNCYFSYFEPAGEISSVKAASYQRYKCFMQKFAARFK
jgi:hypothetical protein